MVVGGGGEVASGCPEGTYDAYWIGDSDDPNGLCVNSGASTKQPTTESVTIHTDYGSGGYAGALVEGTGDERVEWAVSSEDVFDDALGTIWFSVYRVTNTSETVLVEGNAGANTNFIAVTLGNSGRPKGFYKGNNTPDDVNAPAITGAIALSTWTRVRYSWDQASDKHLIGIDDCDAGEYLEATSEGLTEWSASPTGFLVGDEVSNYTPGSMTVYVQDVSVHSTYDAADPNPSPID